jgi:hypothetical protein
MQRFFLSVLHALCEFAALTKLLGIIGLQAHTLKYALAWHQWNLASNRNTFRGPPTFEKHNMVRDSWIQPLGLIIYTSQKCYKQSREYNKIRVYLLGICLAFWITY